MSRDRAAKAPGIRVGFRHAGLGPWPVGRDRSRQLGVTIRLKSARFINQWRDLAGKCACLGMDAAGQSWREWGTPVRPGPSAGGKTMSGGAGRLGWEGEGGVEDG